MKTASTILYLTAIFIGIISICSVTGIIIVNKDIDLVLSTIPMILWLIGFGWDHI
jgi:hypothetical protein